MSGFVKFFRKPTSIGLGIALLAAGLLAWVQPWFSVKVRNASNQLVSVSASGAEGAGTYLAFALVALACFAVIVLANRLVTYLVSCLIFLSALAMIAGVIFSLRNPRLILETEVSKITGMLGSSVSSGWQSSVAVSIWPYLAMVAAGAVAAVAFLVTLVQRTWPLAANRFEAAGTGSVKSSAETKNWANDWDQLADGNDPTDSQPGR